MGASITSLFYNRQSLNALSSFLPEEMNLLDSKIKSETSERELYRGNFFIRLLFDDDKLVGSHSMKIGSYVVFWLFLFLIISAIEGTLVIGNIDFTLTSGLGYLEDLFFFSLLFSVFLFFWMIRRTLTRFYQVFWSDGEFRSNIKHNPENERKYESILRQSISFITHKNLKDAEGHNMARWAILFWVLKIGGTVYFLLLVYNHFFNLSNIDLWYSPSHILATFGWLAFYFFLLVLIGPSLIWRYVASIREIRRIVKETDEHIGLDIPITSSMGGRSFKSFGFLTLRMSFVPLTPLVSLLVWIFFKGEMSDYVIFAIICLAGLAICAFFYPLMGITGIVRKRKEETLKRLSKELYGLHNPFDNAMKGEDATNDEVQRIYSGVNALVMMEGDAIRTPLWPFDWELILKFLAMLVVPFILIVLDHILST